MHRTLNIFINIEEFVNTNDDILIKEYSIKEEKYNKNIIEYSKYNENIEDRITKILEIYDILDNINVICRFNEESFLLKLGEFLRDVNPRKIIKIYLLKCEQEIKCDENPQLMEFYDHVIIVPINQFSREILENSSKLIKRFNDLSLNNAD
ncbi:hypothetical protein TCON_1427 [Astathelohania contejeani]|uniref:Uncharacterized protein n=1 Tax=Astathelohania contejeani TaxID=164912 RepID=A0ABQ7HYV4_9MICR|nr:hypothetical protein TCON_1427 [Thelohania contejeani]